MIRKAKKNMLNHNIIAIAKHVSVNEELQELMHHSIAFVYDPNPKKWLSEYLDEILCCLGNLD